MSQPEVQLARDGATNRRSKAARALILGVLKQLHGAGLTLRPRAPARDMHSPRILRLK